MPICNQCGGWYPKTDRHRCPSIFEYCIPEYMGDEWRKVRTHDHESAAEIACEQNDRESAEYIIVRYGHLDEILVRDEEGTVKRFSITAESVPSYSATEIEESE